MTVLAAPTVWRTDVGQAMRGLAQQVRTREQALAAVEEESRHPTLPAEAGWCLRYVRMQYLIGARYGSAGEACEHADLQVSPPPPGVPVWWTAPGRYGHIAISSGNGWCWSTDWKRTGRFDPARIADISRAWRYTYRGWSPDLNDVIIPDPPHGEGGGEQEDDMPYTREELAAIIRGVLNEGTGQGQTDWAGTSRALLSTAQGLVNRADAQAARGAAWRDPLAAQMRTAIARIATASGVDLSDLSQAWADAQHGQGTDLVAEIATATEED